MNLVLLRLLCQMDSVGARYRSDGTDSDSRGTLSTVIADAKRQIELETVTGRLRLSAGVGNVGVVAMWCFERRWSLQRSLAAGVAAEDG